MRKKIFILFIVLLLVIFIQSFLGAFLKGVFFNNLVLAFVILAAVSWNLEEKFIWQLFLWAGFLTDLYFFYPLGINLLAFFLSTFLFLSLRQKVIPLKERGSSFSLVTFTVALVFFNQVLISFLKELLGGLGLRNLANWSPHYFFENWGANLLILLISIFFAHFLIKKLARFLDLNSKTLIIQR